MVISEILLTICIYYVLNVLIASVLWIKIHYRQIGLMVLPNSKYLRIIKGKAKIIAGWICYKDGRNIEVSDTTKIYRGTEEQGIEEKIYTYVDKKGKALEIIVVDEEVLIKLYDDFIKLNKYVGVVLLSGLLLCIVNR